MDKNFQFHLGLTADAGQFGKSQLPGQNHPFKAHGGGLGHCLGIVHGHQGAGMQGQIRKMASGQMVDSQILNDQGVWSDLIQGSQRLNQFPPFPLLDQGVEGDVELPRALATDLDERGNFGQAEVGGVSAGAKGF
jgi:hypothetical protein